MKDIFTMKAGEVYYLEAKDCFALVISDFIDKNVHFGETVYYVSTRVTEMGIPSPLEAYVGLANTCYNEKMIATISIPSISDKPIAFADSAIRNFNHKDVAKLFPDEPIYTMTEEERETMFCELYGPKCPLSGKRCTACIGKSELPNAERYMIIEKNGQGCD